MSTKNLTAVNGKRFSFFERFDIPDRSNPANTYLRRWYLVSTPWFGIYMHAIFLPDRDPWMHDHPWSFVSIVLKGGYLEGLGNGVRHRWRAGSIHRLRHVDAHAIRSLDRTPTWTLILRGPRRRDWGYHTDQGWVDHATYHRRLGLV